jgi:hypothetical protein
VDSKYERQKAIWNNDVTVPDTPSDFEVGDKEFWFEQMTCKVSYPMGGFAMKKLAICPLTSCLMLQKHVYGWEVFPPESCTMEAYNNFLVEQAIFHEHPTSK